MSLVIDDRTRAYWEKAQTNPERGATKFWEYVLKDQFFNTRDWALSSQQLPTNEASDLRRVELHIERWKNNQWHTILFFEAKKQKCSQTEIDDLEFQEYNACIAHLGYTGRSQIYAMTVTGTSACLWYITKQDDGLLHFVPIDPGLSERAKYIEAYSTGVQDLHNRLNYLIQNNKVSSKKLQVLKSNCSPRTLTASALTRDETRNSILNTPGMPAAQLTCRAICVQPLSDPPKRQSGCTA